MNGIEWMFSDKEVAEILRVPRAGISLFPKNNWHEDKGEILEILFGNPHKGVKNLMNTGLSAVVKAIHQVVVRGLTPRMEKTSNVSVHDAYLMASILTKEPVNLPVLLMKHMQSSARSKTHGLPYPGLVKTLLINAGLYRPRREVPLIHRFDAASLRKMSWGVNTGESEMEERMNRLSEQVDSLHKKSDETLYWLKKLLAGLPTGPDEEIDEEVTSETGSGDAKTGQDEEEGSE